MNHIFLDNSEYYIFTPDDVILTIYYYECDNIFMDENGCLLTTIFDFITPNELYLFKSQQGRSLFPYRYDKDVIVEILSIDKYIEDDYYDMEELIVELYGR